MFPINISYFNDIYAIVPKPEEPYPKDPCTPSPCGSNAMCKAVGETPVCTCINNYIGVPPNCRPQCSINSDCTADKACIREKCRDPCPGSCGVNARCTVVNHTPACTCPEGYTGDPFTSCSPTPPPISKNPDNHSTFFFLFFCSLVGLICK